MTSIALLSDIHGNLPALEAVVADLGRLRPDAVYVLGDMVHGCVWSAEVMDLLAVQGWPMLLGNHDDAVLQLGTPRMEPRYADRVRYAGLWWTRARLSEAQLATLASLPRELSLAFPDAPSVRLLHGLPGNFFVGIRPDSPSDWVIQHLNGVAEAVVAGGHTHVAMARVVGRWSVINSGSVGAPYDGDTRASYVWLTGERTGWHAQVRRVPYDHAAVETAYRTSDLAAMGCALVEMFHRSVMTALPWVSDFAWWLRSQPAEVIANQRLALELYESAHGPGRWAFPYARG
ncbi:MAG: metallophosphoesterase family protein [Anaerolineae bacterium]